MPREDLDMVIDGLGQLQFGDQGVDRPESAVGQYTDSLREPVVDRQWAEQGLLGGGEVFVGQAAVEILLALGVFFLFFCFHLKCSFWCWAFVGCKRKITLKTGISSFC